MRRTRVHTLAAGKKLNNTEPELAYTYPQMETAETPERQAGTTFSEYSEYEKTFGSYDMVFAPGTKPEQPNKPFHKVRISKKMVMLVQVHFDKDEITGKN
jgi:hypothetical protein